MSAFEKPRCFRSEKAGSLSFSSGTPSVSRQNSRPRVNWLKTKEMSKALSTAASTFSSCSGPKPLAERAARFRPGAFDSVP